MSQYNRLHVQNSSDALSATCGQTDMSGRILVFYIPSAHISFLVATPRISDVDTCYVHCAFSVRWTYFLPHLTSISRFPSNTAVTFRVDRSGRETCRRVRLSVLHIDLSNRILIRPGKPIQRLLKTSVHYKIRESLNRFKRNFVLGSFQYNFVCTIQFWLKSK